MVFADVVRIRPSDFAAARFETLRGRGSYDVDEIFFVAQLQALSTMQSFFSANTSGFEALKISGVLDRLQGTGIEQLLSRYYDTVNQIALLENGMYATTRPIITELRREQPRDLESYAVINPSSLASARFQEVQPLYSQLINSPTMSALVNAQFTNQILMLHYDSLQALGQAYVQAVEAVSSQVFDTGIRTPFDNFNEGLG